MKSSFRTDALVTSVFLVFHLVVWQVFEITGDSGDSNLHYLYSRYAPDHLELFFNHWAKPLFVLLSFPFAQGGFQGIVLLNILLSCLTLWMSMRVASNLRMRHTWLLAVALVSAPLYFRLTFSGLTEFLFAAVLLGGVLLAQKQKMIWAAVFISFLPFVRSEGLLIVGLFGFWFMINKRWKVLPWLTSGNVAYGLAGAAIHGNVLWVFTKVPYAKLSSTYGHGEWFDFVHRLAYVIEKPNYALLLVGLWFLGWALVRSKPLSWLRSEWTLIWGSFGVYFVAHAVFWATGIFNSMGLPRVLIAVVPCIALIEVFAIERLGELLAFRGRKPVVHIVCTSALLLFPFTDRPEGVVVGKEMFLVPENALFDSEVKPLIKHELYDKNPLIYNDPYVSVSLEIDHFDSTKHLGFEDVTLSQLQSGTLVIWDSWFAAVEGGISEDALNDAFQIHERQEFASPDATRSYRIIQIP